MWIYRRIDCAVCVQRRARRQEGRRDPEVLGPAELAAISRSAVARSYPERTVIVTEGVSPPWASLGVQLKTPVEASMVMPSASEAASRL